MEIKSISIQEKLKQIHKLWDPKIIATLNGQDVKLAKLKGEFIWHHHENEDELFFVIEGCLEMHFKDRIEIVDQGEMILVPKGVEHKPVAKEEVKVLLFEPSSTLNTGNVDTELTKKNPERI